jgi:hypothetical protein
MEWEVEELGRMKLEVEEGEVLPVYLSAPALVRYLVSMGICGLPARRSLRPRFSGGNPGIGLRRSTDE